MDSDWPSKDVEKRVVENFLLFASDPVETLTHVTGQIHDVFDQLLAEVNTNDDTKRMFTHTMGYLMEIAELYFNSSISN